MPPIISRGEIWSVNFDPQIGAEIQKKRPAVVINMKHVNYLPLHIVVPITKAENRYNNIFWMIALSPTTINGLKSNSFADASQVKSIAIERFGNKIGILETAYLNEIVAAVVLCIGYTPPRP